MGKATGLSLWRRLARCFYVDHCQEVTGGPPLPRHPPNHLVWVTAGAGLYKSGFPRRKSGNAGGIGLASTSGRRGTQTPSWAVQGNRLKGR